jgi:alcohol dehydrogenase
MSEMISLTAIEAIARYLPIAVKDGKNLKAREKVAFASYLGGIEMVVCSTVSEHSMEHSLSSFHQELPHGAGLIMLSEAYFTYFIEHHVCDGRFVRLAQALGMTDATEPMDFITALKHLQNECGVGDLKMSDYGITPDEFPQMAHIAKTAMAFLFTSDRIDLSEEDVVEIYQKAYK